jgi:hypothetical protein
MLLLNCDKRMLSPIWSKGKLKWAIVPTTNTRRLKTIATAMKRSVLRTDDIIILMGLQPMASRIRDGSSRFSFGGARYPEACQSQKRTTKILAVQPYQEWSDFMPNSFAIAMPSVVKCDYDTQNFYSCWPGASSCSRAVAVITASITDCAGS